jgi:Adenosine deaminase
MRQNPESIYCLPVKINPPWDSKRNLYIRQNVANCETSKDFHNLCTCRGYRSLSEMLNCFEVFLPLVRGNIQLIEELAYDFCQRQWEQNVVYCEVRYSPHLLAEGFTDNISDKDRDMSKGFEKLAITPQAVFHAVTRVCFIVVYCLENHSPISYYNYLMIGFTAGLQPIY